MQTDVLCTLPEDAVSSPIHLPPLPPATALQEDLLEPWWVQASPLCWYGHCDILLTVCTVQLAFPFGWMEK